MEAIEDREFDRIIPPGVWEFNLQITFPEDLHPVFGTPLERLHQGRVELKKAVGQRDLCRYLANELGEDHMDQQIQSTLALNPWKG